MNIIELFIIAVGLSMDAFAVAVCKGLSMKKINIGKSAVVGLYFGIFQAVMPLIGYFLGIQFHVIINSVDHWIAFVLLALIGGNMVRESLKKDDEAVIDSMAEEVAEDPLNFKNMIMLSIATSIDALAVGVTFAFLDVNIAPAVSIIGSVTFILSMVGVKIGNVFGNIYKLRAEFTGGVILVLMGAKILLEHLGVINF